MTGKDSAKRTKFLEQSGLKIYVEDARGGIVFDQSKRERAYTQRRVWLSLAVEQFASAST